MFTFYPVNRIEAEDDLSIGAHGYDLFLSKDFEHWSFDLSHYFKVISTLAFSKTETFWGDYNNQMQFTINSDH